MNQLISFFCFILIASSLWAGNNVDSRREMIMANQAGDFVILDYWAVDPYNDEMDPSEYPMFLSVFDTNGSLKTFMELPEKGGLNRSTAGTKPYQKVARAELDKAKSLLSKEGFNQDNFVKLKVAHSPRSHSTIELLDGRTIEDIGVHAPRKKNQYQKEKISLWLKEKNGQKRLLRKDIFEEVIRSYSQQMVNGAYWIPSQSLVVAVYDRELQTEERQSTTVWTWKDSKLQK